MSNRSPILLIVCMRYSDKTVFAWYSSGEADKEGVREQVASNANAKSGGRYTAAGGQQSIHYILDTYGRVYSIVTHSGFSQRAAFAILDELQKDFQRDFGNKIGSAPEDSLSRTARPLLKEFCDKYANAESRNNLTELQGKIDVVKSVMQENIQQILLNQEQVERINSSAERLNEQSMAFKSSTHELRNKMWWKMIKMRLLIGFVIVCVLIVIIVPAVIMAQGAKNST